MTHDSGQVHWHACCPQAWLLSSIFGGGTPVSLRKKHFLTAGLKETQETMVSENLAAGPGHSIG